MTKLIMDPPEMPSGAAPKFPAETGKGDAPFKYFRLPHVQLTAEIGWEAKEDAMAFPKTRRMWNVPLTAWWSLLIGFGC